jgi:hypothetical protein
MAFSMEAVGVVCTSERKSKAAGLLVEPQALFGEWPLGTAGLADMVGCFVPLDV